jgi:outer membrane protein OmpA-like peptidoglycan-associated protein
VKKARMTPLLRGALLLVATGLACNRPLVVPRAVVPEKTPEPDLIVLLGEANQAAPGHASVSSPAGTVELTSEGATTRVVSNQAPSPVSIMDEDDVKRIFGNALAVMPTPPRLFVLHFRFESDDLIERSRAALPDVLRAVAAYPAPEVVVIGHTDTAGTTRANFELGLRRANAVRRHLVDIGIDPSVIALESHGEASPLVQTPDDTFEPRNRRVEIAVR